MQKRKDAEYCILTAAKLIANANLDENFTEGKFKEMLFPLF